MFDSRERILAAAARVYAAHGFKGATTRRIAHEAGVNEVTLFRTFGSKRALIEEALRQAGEATAPPHALPEVPRDPERELVHWATLQLTELREQRALIRQTMSELEERSELAPCVAAGWAAADLQLQAYLVRLGRAGFVAWTADDECSVSEGVAETTDLFAAGSMLMAALFSDAMGRDMMPGLYPQPADRAPALYVRLFLRAAGFGPPVAAPQHPHP
jgi:AcrR family transcriptional regulator